MKTLRATICIDVAPEHGNDLATLLEAIREAVRAVPFVLNYDDVLDATNGEEQ